MNKERLDYLIRRHVSGELTFAERVELMEWIADEKNRGEFVEWAASVAIESVERVAYDEDRWEPVLRVVLAQDRSMGDGVSLATELPDDTRQPGWVRMRWWMAAAALLVVCVGAFWLSVREKTAVVAPVVAKQDVEAPERARAVITLADGSQLSLDSAGAGTMGKQGGVEIIKQANGQVAYRGEKESSAQIEYNTLTVPKGSRVVQLKLGDGTRVWINCGSSLRYPVVFAGKERMVDVSGEAYFEVAPNAEQPFVVRHDSLSVRVIGTHFNVNAYGDEKLVSVTLLEGAVRVGRNGASLLLHRGQQAVGEGAKAAGVAGLRMAADVDTSAVMAWKNGLFQFGDATDIAVVMRQLARWYDVDVEYKGGSNGHIGGTISRGANISKVLGMLELTGAVHFKVEGKKVTVLP